MEESNKTCDFTERIQALEAFARSLGYPRGEPWTDEQMRPFEQEHRARLEAAATQDGLWPPGPRAGDAPCWILRIIIFNFILDVVLDSQDPVFDVFRSLWDTLCYFPRFVMQLIRPGGTDHLLEFPSGGPPQAAPPPPPRTEPPRTEPTAADMFSSLLNELNTDRLADDGVTGNLFPPPIPAPPRKLIDESLSQIFSPRLPASVIVRLLRLKREKYQGFIHRALASPDGTLGGGTMDLETVFSKLDKINAQLKKLEADGKAGHPPTQAQAHTALAASAVPSQPRPRQPRPQPRPRKPSPSPWIQTIQTARSCCSCRWRRAWSSMRTPPR